MTSRTGVALGIQALLVMSVQGLRREVVEGARQGVDQVAGDESSMPGLLRSAAMHVGRSGRSGERIEPPSEEPADDAGEHVTAAGRGERCPAEWVDRHAAVRVGDDGAWSLEQ